MEKQTKNINKIPKGTEFSTHFEEGFNTLSGEHFFPEEDKLCFDYFDRKNNIFIMYENNGKRGIIVPMKKMNMIQVKLKLRKIK